MTHICISKLTIIASDNGLSPGWHQAIIWTNDGILLIRSLGTNFSEILSEIHTCSFQKMHLKTSSAKWRPFCLGLNVLSITFHIMAIRWNETTFMFRAMAFFRWTNNKITALCTIHDLFLHKGDICVFVRFYEISIQPMSFSIQVASSHIVITVLKYTTNLVSITQQLCVDV